MQRLEEQRVKLVKLDELIPHPANTNEGDVGVVVDSISENGWYGVVLAQLSTNRILAGHTRTEAARILGITRVPVIFLDVDDDEAARILLVDNKSNRLGRDDEAKLSEVLLTMQQETTRSLLGTGYDDDDVHQLLARVHTPLDLGNEVDNSRRGHRAHRCPHCLAEWEGSCTPDD